MRAATVEIESAQPEARTRTASVEGVLLGLLLLFTFAKGVFWAVQIAPLDSPDEPSHFNYVIQVREGYLLPVVVLVSPGGLLTPPSTPLNQDVRTYFNYYDFKFFRSMPYESAQPPLYYWLAALWTRPLGIAPSTLPSLLLAARFMSVLLGTCAVFAVWLACRWAMPGRPLVAWATPLALTLSPEFSFTTATVTNDAGVIFWGAVLLALWGFGIRERRAGVQISRSGLWVLVILAGLATAAGLLTKLTFAATIPATLLWLWWLGGRVTWQSLLGRLVVFGGVVGGLVLPWVVRNQQVYGEPTGARGVFDLIHRIYWQRMGFPPGQPLSNFPLPDFVVRSVRSFWALFGWASVWLSDWVYWLLAGFSVLAMVGLVLRWRLSLPPWPGSSLVRLTLLSSLTCLLAFANYVAYNNLVEFQPHMRYTFVALSSAFVLLCVGIGRGPWGSRGRTVLLTAFVAFLAVVQVMSLVVLSAHTGQVLASLPK